MLGFLTAFAVKLPNLPFHTLALTDGSCAEASTATNLLLASLLATTAAYAMIRFLLPLFPEAVHARRTGRDVARGDRNPLQRHSGLLPNNLMRLVAYASISHLGFVLLGIFCPGIPRACAAP